MTYIRKSLRCPNCRGTGQDGEPPDPCDGGGGVWSCDFCNGTGLKAVADEVFKRRAAERDAARRLELLREARAALEFGATQVSMTLNARIDAELEKDTAPVHPLDVGGVRHDSNCRVFAAGPGSVQRPACSCGAVR